MCGARKTYLEAEQARQYTRFLLEDVKARAMLLIKIAVAA